MLFNSKRNTLGLSFLETLLNEPRPIKKAKKLNPILAAVAITMAGILMMIGGVQLYSIVTVDPLKSDVSSYLARKLDTASVEAFYASSSDYKSHSDKKLSISYALSYNPTWDNFMGRFKSGIDTALELNPAIIDLTASSWKYKLELKNFSPTSKEDKKTYNELLLFFQDLVQSYPLINFDFEINFEQAFAPQVSIKAIDNWTTQGNTSFVDLGRILSNFQTTFRLSKSYVPGINYTLKLGLRSDLKPVPLVIEIPFLSISELDKRIAIPPTTLMGLAGFYRSTQDGVIDSMVYSIPKNQTAPVFNVVIKKDDDPTKKEEVINASHKTADAYWEWFITYAPPLPYRVEVNYGTTAGETIFKLQE